MIHLKYRAILVVIIFASLLFHNIMLIFIIPLRSNCNCNYNIILCNNCDDIAKSRYNVFIINCYFTVPPEITDQPEPKPLLAIGENHTLTCNASGDPLPNISWTKDGIPVDRFYVTGYQLYLFDVKLEDVGSYRCTASNGYGDNVTSVSIVGIRCK